MNYKAFFQDVTIWMDQINEVVQRHSIFTDEYWDHVVKSAGELCNKYGNHELVKQQMSMLIGYLDQQYRKAKGGADETNAQKRV
ncbi:hypothetical protein [Candidatus Enterococcus clewellii]|uniref:Uncharacterized protein n=1 Tax=Candidatus Enterococcus clewellii TaxID=1834193 RepID=A0A242K8U4_9ENTE|nr:hypothetical protein [Enterococcus sp. 9E7_DIV0242]OTP17572.1 hypothetical protein A5888_001710 [Enterococcus sp. 9E7_DIV0242]